MSVRSIVPSVSVDELRWLLGRALTPGHESESCSISVSGGLEQRMRWISDSGGRPDS